MGMSQVYTNTTLTSIQIKTAVAYPANLVQLTFTKQSRQFLHDTGYPVTGLLSVATFGTNRDGNDTVSIL